MIETPRPRHVTVALATTIGLVLLSACADAGAGDERSPSAETPSRPVRSDGPGAPIPSSSGAPVAGEVPADLLERIVSDAADRTAVEAAAIEVVRAESVTWNDGSLGCPEPGMFYTQALVPGYHVVVQADGGEIDYRATQDGSFRLCENPGPPSGG